ncbi:MAG: hypothetical protein IT280_05205 [Ignavibacteria bacterium]|nr:hypothetical protein [Ignavibacteria bacterium]
MKHTKIFSFLLFFGVLLMLSMILQKTAASDSTSGDYKFVSISYPPKTLQKVVWREDVYDPSLNENINVLKLDENYFANIPGSEKAVLGYLASTIGNECYADGSMLNIKCKLLSALNLGCQCSEESKSFLRTWFREDKEILNQIENCKPTITTTVEKTFDEVKILNSDNKIVVELKGLKLNLKENTESRWKETLNFKLDGDKLFLTERTKNK